MTQHGWFQIALLSRWFVGFLHLGPAKTEFHRNLLACLRSRFRDVPEIVADSRRAAKLRKSGGCCRA